MWCVDDHIHDNVLTKKNLFWSRHLYCKILFMSLVFWYNIFISVLKVAYVYITSSFLVLWWAIGYMPTRALHKKVYLYENVKKKEIEMEWIRLYRGEFMKIYIMKIWNSFLRTKSFRLLILCLIYLFYLFLYIYCTY